MHSCIPEAGTSMEALSITTTDIAILRTWLANGISRRQDRLWKVRRPSEKALVFPYWKCRAWRCADWSKPSISYSNKEPAAWPLGNPLLTRVFRLIDHNFGCIRRGGQTSVADLNSPPKLAATMAVFLQFHFDASREDSVAVRTFQQA